MAKQKEVKTNAMRILESLKIPYTHHTYECEEFVDGLQIADKLSLPYEQVYKTLVTVGSSKNYFVFVIPIAEELDMKKQRNPSEKKRGDDPCKRHQCHHRLHPRRLHSHRHEKQYVTRIDESAKTQEQIYVSGGRIGSQIQLKPDDLAKAAKAEFADIIRHDN